MRLITENNIRNAQAYLTHIRLSTCIRSEHGTSSSARYERKSTYIATGKVAPAAAPPWELLMTPMV
jgi:hypothetical protein